MEQKLLYDHETIKPAGFTKTGFILNKSGEVMDVWTRKTPPTPVTNWTLEELRSLSVFKLKKIAREMGIFTIPGRAGKHSLMRAILAEGAIAGKGQFPIPNSQFPIPSSQPPAIEPPNPARYYWLNATHKSQAAALEKLGWEFTPNAEIDGDLCFLQKYKDWEFYSVTGEPLLVANLKGASFAIDCSAIAGDWNKEIDKAKRAIKAVKPEPLSEPKQLNLLELIAV